MYRRSRSISGFLGYDPVSSQYVTDGEQRWLSGQGVSHEEGCYTRR